MSLSHWKLRIATQRFAMADNAPEKPDVAAPVAGTKDKLAGEGEVAAKTVDKAEAGDATMEEAKEATGELPQRACSELFAHVQSSSHAGFSFILQF